MTTLDAVLTVPIAHITRWPSLTDTQGAPNQQPWPEFFSALSAPRKFLGDHRHPGWSAAVFDPPVRVDANVVGLSALVLDYDAGTSIADAADLWADYYGFLHTTRKHTPDAPRFRVVLPFTRIITPAEYAVVWRWAAKIADHAGQRVDQSTKNPGRFWYLPGTLTGDAPETLTLTGAVLDPDPLIAADSYERNEHARAVAAPVTGDIERRAVRYLDRMDPAISGSGGHAALWAAAQAVVRGFRLTGDRGLRLLSEHYNPRCQPPWSDRELRHKVTQAETQSRLEWGYLADRARVADAPPDDGWEPPPFDDGATVHHDEPDLTPPPAPAATGPRQSSATGPNFSVTSNGQVRNTLANLVEALTNHDEWRGRLSFDDMRVTPCLDSDPVSDPTLGRMRVWFEHHLGIAPAEANMRAAVAVVADRSHRHAVRDYLNALAWDGTPRIASVLTEILGAKDTELGQSTIRKWFISAVARALSPGCKVDTALVLVGPQGWRKSSFFAALGDPWFVDTGMDIDSNDGRLQLHSAWIYEWAEIESVTGRKDASNVKAFVSSSSDTFREPYGRSVGAHARSGIIVGTTNEDQFLADPTGSRRFWIITIGRRVDTDAIRAMRDQLWAEARAAYLAGEPWWLTETEEVERQTRAAKYESEDPWQPIVSAWLANGHRGSYLTSSDVLRLALDLPTSQITKAAQARVGGVLRRLGYSPRRLKGSGCKVRIWVANE